MIGIASGKVCLKKNQLWYQRFNLSLCVTGRDIRTRVLQLVVPGSGVTIVVSEQG